MAPPLNMNNHIPVSFPSNPSNGLTPGHTQASKPHYFSAETRERYQPQSSMIHHHSFPAQNSQQYQPQDSMIFHSRQPQSKTSYLQDYQRNQSSESQSAARENGWSDFHGALPNPVSVFELEDTSSQMHAREVVDVVSQLLAEWTTLPHQ